jgi:hypothetical protein
MPSIQKLAQRLSNDKDVAFVMVSLDNSPDVVIDFMKENGYALPVFMPRANPPKELRSQGVPLTVILDRDQKVRFRHMGSQDWNTPEVAQMLRKYAKESSSTTAPEAAKSSESSPKKGTP